MKNEYTGERLIKNSRYKEYYKKMDTTTQESVIKRIDILINENAKYCDKRNHNHLSNIFTSIALYENLQKKHSKEDAFKILSRTMWDYVEKKSWIFRKMSRMPYILKLMGILLPRLFERGSGYGWKYRWHKDLSDNNQLKFECTECIYQQIFERYNMEELGPMFCYADDINYGHLNNIVFTRNHTLCRDGKSCDFLFRRK